MGAPGQDAEEERGIVREIVTFISDDPVPIVFVCICTYTHTFSLAKKSASIDKPVPIQPMDLIQEIKCTPVNKIDSELDN